MKRIINRLGVAAAFGLVLAAGLALTVSTATAQPMIISGGPGGGGFGRGAEPPVSTGELDRYGNLLGLTDEQREAAKSLLEAMQAEHQEMSAKNREEMQALRDEFQESQDPAIFRDKMPEIMGRMRAGREKLEKGFFDDMKTMLTDEQSAKWGSLERMRRRDQQLPRGRLAGEALDLVRVVDDLKLPKESEPSLKPLMEQYEADLDRALGERTKIQEEKMPSVFGAGGMMRLEQGAQDGELQKVMAEMREASKKIRDVNQRYARQIAAALPTEAQPKFDKAVQKASFPSVYRETYAQKALRAASKYNDLTPEQKKAVDTLMEEYERESESINSKWASTIREMDEKGGGAEFMLPGMGGAATFRMRTGEDDGGEQKDPQADHRAARKKLDDRMVDSLKSTLNDDQKSRLPEKRQRPDGGELSEGVVEGVGVFATVSTTTGPDGVHSQTTEVHAVTDGSTIPPGEEGTEDVIIVTTAPGGAPAEEKKPVEPPKP